MRNDSIFRRIYCKAKKLKRTTIEIASLSYFMREPRIGTMNSIARDNWVISSLDEVTAHSSLLDAGAGEQKYRKYCSHLNYIAQDNIAYDGKGDGQGGHVQSWSYGLTDFVCDIVAIPVADASFDAVLCTEVLEHLPNPVAAVTELARILRPGGKLILTAPFCSLTHFSPFFYSTGFSRNWYIEHLGELGFNKIELAPNGNFFEYLAQELRRTPMMASSFSSQKESWLVRLAMIILLRFLDKCSLFDRGSNEHCCFGWHVKAVKAS